MKNDKSNHRRKSKNGKSHHNFIIDQCINRIRNNSGDFMAYFNLAHELKSQGDLTGALKYYDKGLKRFSNNIPALINRALIYIFLCNFTKAIADLCKAIVSDPFQPKAYIYRAIAYWGAGRKSEAIDDFNHVNQFFPEYTDLFTVFDYTMDPLPGFKEALDDCLATGAIVSMLDKAFSQEKVTPVEEICPHKENSLKEEKLFPKDQPSTVSDTTHKVHSVPGILLKRRIHKLLRYYIKVRHKLSTVFNCLLLLLLLPLNDILVDASSSFEFLSL